VPENLATGGAVLVVKELKARRSNCTHLASIGHLAQLAKLAHFSYQFKPLRC